MAKTPTVWFRKHAGWCTTTVRGVQHRLAKTESDAKRASYKLTAGDVPAPVPKTERHSVRWLRDKFLDRTTE